MHDQLLAHQGALTRAGPARLRRRAGPGHREVRRRPAAAAPGAAKIARDVDSADLSAVSGTPTFFINGRRHFGAYDIEHLSAAVRAARVRAAITTRA